ncbi:MAG: small multi-drug export protein [Candidatus Aenigmatarchaeota archaeon]
MLNEIALVAFVAMLPVSELRGAIPLGISLGLPLEYVIIVSLFANCLAFFPIYFGLELLYERFFIRYLFCRNLMEKSRKRVEPYISRYGIIGLAVFIGIPLPVTGVWTGTIVAWVLGLDWKKSFLAVCLGVLMAAAIVSMVVLGFLAGLGFVLG